MLDNVGEDQTGLLTTLSVQYGHHFSTYNFNQLANKENII
jgi:hypothetical protein